MEQVELQWLAPAMKQVIPIVQQVFRQCAPAVKVEFTAGKEWFHHGMYSLHHSGNAVDIRTRTLPDHGIGGISAHLATTLQRALDTRFGKHKYTVLRNDQGPTKPHIHIQFNAGGRWSEPGDFGGSRTRTA